MEKEKKKKILKIATRIVSFVAIVAIVYSYACIIFYPNHGDESNKDYYSMRGFEGEEKNTVDVMAVGSSNTWVGFIPMELYKGKGISAYNNGIDQQSRDRLFGLFNESLSYQRPKVLLLDTEILTLTTNKKYSKNKPSSSFWKSPYLYHKRWKKLSYDDFFNFSTSDESLYFLLNKGYYLKTNSVKLSSIGYDDSMADYKKIDETIVNSFLEPIVELTKEYDCQLVFVTYPIGIGYKFRSDHAIDALAEKYHVSHIDFNKYLTDLCFDKNKDFYNFGHVNYWGAKKISKYLATYLSENYDLTDYRDHPNKNSKMEESLAYYEEETKNL